jgi:hypothetical protein
LREYEKVLRRKFEPKTQEVIEGWRTLHDEDDVLFTKYYWGN